MRRVVLLSALAFAACGRLPTGPIFTGEPAASADSREFERWLDEKDRREMIRPAAPDWRPAKAAAAELRIIVPKTSIRLGEALPFRLEFQNTGKESIKIEQTFSAFKGSPGPSDDEFQIWIDAPDGSRSEDKGKFTGGEGCGDNLRPILPRWIPEAKRNKLVEENVARKGRLTLSESRLNVEVRSGETLVSRPWRDDAGLDSCADAWRAEELNFPAQDGYRHLRADNFKSPGTYRIHFTYVDAVGRMGDKKIASQYSKWEGVGVALLRSNVVDIAVNP